jgi:hypothetical protein
VIHGLVVGPGLERPDQRIDGVGTERRHRTLSPAPEVALHGLANHGRQARAAPGRLVAQLPIGLLGEAEVGGYIPWHCGITIPLAADRVKTAAGTRAYFSVASQMSDSDSS